MSAPTKLRLKKGLSVGSALIAGVGLSSGATAPLPVNDAEVTVTARMQDACLLSDQVAVSTYIPRIGNEIPSEWARSDARRFRALAAKRALGTATQEENKEFASLQRQRRAAEQVSTSELMFEWNRRKFISELIDLISRHVSFFKAEDQARFGALRETTQA